LLRHDPEDPAPSLPRQQPERKYLMSVTVPASQVRVPSEARDAVSRREAVTVVSHRRSQYVILHPYDYAVVSAMPERYRAGCPIPVEQLLTGDDLAILREEPNDVAGDGILE
jgi:hypothetical protein